MKKLNLILLLFLSGFLFSCEPKKEQKEPVIIQNNQKIKYDDEPASEKANDSINKKAILTKKIVKRSVG